MGIKKLLLALFLICIAPSAQAARGFGATYGTGATVDSIQTGQGPFATITSISISVWYWKNGVGSGSGGAVLSNLISSSTGYFVATNGGTPTNMRFLIGFNGANGLSTWDDAGEGVWQHSCIVYSTVIGPTVYVNGNSVSLLGGLSSPISSAINTFIGSRDGTQSYWDGKIGDVAIWNSTLLTASECLALSKGASPLQIRPTALSYYWPLYGKTSSGEPDWGPSHGAQTVTGTTFQPHAPVQPIPLQKRAQ